MINRDDMLELTRRLTPSRNCFSRIAGAYMDADGFEDGTFNIHFGKLSPAETKRNLEIAKAIPFSWIFSPAWVIRKFANGTVAKSL